MLRVYYMFPTIYDLNYWINNTYLKRNLYNKMNLTIIMGADIVVYQINCK